MSLAGRQKKVNACTHTEYHSPTCNGHCGKVQQTELEIALEEELAAWSKAGMGAAGVPTSLTHLGVKGIPVDLFQVSIKLTALIEALDEAEIIDKDTVQQRFQKEALKVLSAIREKVEGEVKAAQAAAKIEVTSKRLLDPNGRPFH